MTASRGHRMLAEIREIPKVVRRQLADGLPIYREIGDRLRRLDPPVVATCARGTSDHAATYFKYLSEMTLGVPVASVGPSVASVYAVRLRLSGAACVTISQSGGSPDLVALQTAARDGGALTVAILNVVDSPVGVGADAVAPLLAGPEMAVAATKSYVASLVALAAVVSAWAGDGALEDGLLDLPDALDASLRVDWSPAAAPIAAADSVFTIGRGVGLSVAREAALKFKETCRLHAEAYSAAEVRHGPIALARDRFGALVFGCRDAGRPSVLDAVRAMRDAGARVFLADTDPNGGDVLPLAPAPHPLLDPACAATSFYAFVAGLAIALGEDPDRPKGLSKVTETR